MLNKKTVNRKGQCLMSKSCTHRRSARRFVGLKIIYCRRRRQTLTIYVKAVTTVMSVKTVATVTIFLQ